MKSEVHELHELCIAATDELIETQQWVSQMILPTIDNKDEADGQSPMKCLGVTCKV